MRKQIGLRMNDETRGQLERIREYRNISRTDYIEGAVLAQIARDLKKMVIVGVDIPGEAMTAFIEEEPMSPNMDVVTNEGATRQFSTFIRSSAESKANVMPVPKGSPRGRK